jgi:hypothetical protein
MLRRSRLLVLAAAAAALVAPAAASADTPPPADCPLWAPHARVEHAIPGTNLAARDPYGGLLARNRLFFSFSVRGPQADLAKVANVRWQLDGTAVRDDPKAPFQWSAQSGSSKRMPAGDHTIRVTVTPTGGGAPASTSFPLTATDCQPAGFQAFLARRRGASTYTFTSAIERGGGPALTGVDLTRRANVAVTLPRALRGHRIGTLKIADANGRTIKTYTLKGAPTALSSGGVQARFLPGAQRFLQVTGLPADARAVSIRLASGIASLRSLKKAYSLAGGLSAGTAHVSVTSGGRYV